MWLFTNFGFFSVVQKKGNTDLVVRSRVKADLEALRDRYIPTLGPIIKGGGTDYQYRAKVSHAAFSQAVAHIVFDIKYDNFKDSVAAEQGDERSQAYEAVWTSMRNLGWEQSDH